MCHFPSCCISSPCLSGDECCRCFLSIQYEKVFVFDVFRDSVQHLRCVLLFECVCVFWLTSKSIFKWRSSESKKLLRAIDLHFESETRFRSSGWSPICVCVCVLWYLVQIFFLLTFIHRPLVVVFDIKIRLNFTLVLVALGWLRYKRLKQLNSTFHLCATVSITNHLYANQHSSETVATLTIRLRGFLSTCSTRACALRFSY